MRPSGLTAVCVIGLCLAGFGCVSLLQGSVGLMVQPLIQDFVLQMQQGAPPAAMQAQKDMQEAIMAVQMRWMPLMIGSLLVQLATVVLLFVGCIKGLKMSRGAHRWLIVAMIVGLIQALVYVGLTVGMQQEMQTVMSQQMMKMMQAGPGGPPPPGVGRMMSGMMNLGATLGIIIAGGWALLKGGYYATTIWYVLQPRVKRLFDPDEFADETDFAAPA